MTDFAILDNVWSFWLALQEIILYGSQKKSYCLYIYVPKNISQLLLSVVEPLIFTGTGW